MRVVLVSGSYPPLKCGVGDYAANLAAALEATGLEVGVVTSLLEPSSHLGDARVCPVMRDWGIGSTSTIIRAIKGMSPDVVNVQYPANPYGRHPMVNLLPWLVQNRLGLPVISTIHEYTSFTRLGRTRMGLTARLSRRVIVTDVLNLEPLKRWGDSPDKFVHIPVVSNISCAPGPEFDRGHFRSQYGVSDDSIVLAFFGFVTRSKQLDVLLRAFALAVDQAPQLDLRLWLLADSEPVSPNERAFHLTFAEQLASSPQRQRMVWTGYLDSSQVSAHLLAADVAVLPFGDGASLRRTSIQAALSHGLPVISTVGASNAVDSIGEAQGLLLVSNGDEKALSAAILTLAQDKARRCALSSRAQAYASGISWSMIAECTLEQYRQAIED